MRNIAFSTPFDIRRRMVRLPADLTLNMAALVVGAGTGLGAVAFIWLMARVSDGAAALQAAIGHPLGLLVTMGAGGLIVGFIIERWAKEAKGHGVPEVMEAIVLRNGQIRSRVAGIKVLASSITIGVGGSAGREGPIVQVGSALGSTVAQLLRLPSDNMRTLVACGAAAGIAATFNAPIAGAIFALEVILGRFTVRYFGAVVLSSVAGSVVGRTFLSNQPAFRVPAYRFNSLAELPIYIVLSLLAAMLAVGFIKLLYSAENAADKWHVPLAVKAALGMIATAAISLLLPEGKVLGSGVHLIGEAIAEDFEMPLRMMAALLVLKMVATTATLGTGNSGGVFAPSLFMGATLGGIVGTLAHQWWPTVALNPGAYAIVGMAALFSASARAPITAILIVFEMSGDYHLILPLMLATVLATLVSEQLMKDSIYTLKLTQRGIRVQDGRDEDVLEGITVSEVMQRDIASVPATLTLTEISHRLSHSHQHGFPVVDGGGQLVGIVTLSDLERAVQEALPPDTPVSQFAMPYKRLIVLPPTSSIGEALQAMERASIGRIPIVDPLDSHQLLGLVTRYDVVSAYNVGLTRRAEIQHRAKQMEIDNLDGTEFVHIEIQDDDGSRDHTISELAATLPTNCVLVSIRRNRRMLIPHGDTRLRAGDQVTAFVDYQDRDKLIDSLHHDPTLAVVPQTVGIVE